MRLVGAEAVGGAEKQSHQADTAWNINVAAVGHCWCIIREVLVLGGRDPDSVQSHVML